MNDVFTIGFTKKTAKQFFDILSNNGINMVIDVRLNNVSQLSAFAKYPDIEYFLKKISNIEYKHDLKFAPGEEMLKRYRKKEISWEEYKEEFKNEMRKRNATEWIKDNYKNKDKICLMCSEHRFENCHRTLIAELFQQIFEVNIIHL